MWQPWKTPSGNTCEADVACSSRMMWYDEY